MQEHIMELGKFLFVFNSNPPTLHAITKWIFLGLTILALGLFPGGVSAATYYQDNDGDGYGNGDISVDQSTQPAGYVPARGDCDDTNSGINPLATDVCGDGIDQDCSGADNVCTDDGDGDGFTDNQGDCNDNESTVYPRATEVCNDGVDQDCEAGDKPCRDSGCLNIVNYPIESQFKPSPPIIMFLMDNSGSMDFSILTTEENGMIGNRGNVYEDPANAYHGTFRELNETDRSKWRVMWHGYNLIFYNPALTYEPWPDTENYTNLRAFADPAAADPHWVKSHPITGSTIIDLDAPFQTMADNNVDSPIASYYVVRNNRLYLVTLTGGQIRYFTPQNPNYVQETTGMTFVEVSGNNVPNITNRSYLAERQNFANWFTFYRRRNYVAIRAVSNLLRQMTGAYIGLYSINTEHDENKEYQVVINPPVAVGIEGVNESNTLIEQLYRHKTKRWSTPLRRGLQNVGRFFDAKDTHEIEGLGDSPYLSEVDGGACQQSFAVMLTDGFWTHLDSISVGDLDNDTHENTIADVAMYFYDRDLSDLQDLVPTNTVDRKNTQHMVTYGIAYGVSGDIDPDDYPDCPQACENVIPDCDACPSEWGDPYGISADHNTAKVDHFYHAAINGRGKIYSAYNLQEFNAAITQLQEDIEFASGTGASLAVQGTQAGTGTTIYQPSYQSEVWTGDLRAYGFNSGTFNLNSAYTWSASAKLTEKLAITNWFSNGTGRKIITNVGNTAKVFNTGDGDDLNMSDDLINYLRGDDSLEGTGNDDYRERSAPLGDIVRSAPVPKNGLVFVGANDGMLHAFEQTTGIERFAYIPGFVHGNLPELTRQNYAHHYFVNATPYVRDINSSTTYLTGGLGKGGKGIYCLDISTSKLNPATETIAKNIFKWVYPTTTDNDMGYSYSRPYIVNSKAGWVVIFGNGYNSTNGKASLYVVKASDGTLVKKIQTEFGNAGSQCNGLSTPTLIDTDYDGKVDYAYAGDLQGNMWKFDLTDDDEDNWGVYFKDASNTPQPLFRAKNKDDEIQPITVKPDVIRICDPEREGYMVVFATGRFLGNDDFTDDTEQSVYGIWDWSEDWKINGETAAQRVTHDKYWGTFKAPSLPSVHRFFSNMETNTDFTANGRKTTLLQQKDLTTTAANARVITNLPINLFPVGDADTTTLYHAGWYIDLTKARERVYQDLIVRDGKALFITAIPSRSACLAGGTSHLFEVNVCNGGRTNNPILDINNDNRIDANDTVAVQTQVPNPDGPGTITQTITLPPSGVKFNTLLSLPVILGVEENIRERKFFSTSAGNITTIDEVPERTGVYYWQEHE